ncbi:MAG: FAD-dependent oxidoreductase, partial [Halobacteriota archaeon]
MSGNGEYDVIVMGGGPGGATAAMNAARAGLKTA